MGVYTSLREDARSGRYKTPPPEFAGAMGFTGASGGFLLAAWGLFTARDAARRLPHKDVQDSLRGGEKLVLDDVAEQPTADIKSHFLDSGSFSLWGKAKAHQKKHGGGAYDYYDTPEHWLYLTRYAEFVRKHADGIDYYANVDVIPNPDLTWRNQQHLEQMDMNPVPVVHYRTDLKWLKLYLGKGHPVIALGGLVGSMDTPACRQWLDAAFDVICNTHDRTPWAKIHGFGVTNHDLLLRYPWFSVDNAAWTKVGGFGGIFVPHKRGKDFDMLEPAYILKVSGDSPELKKGRHYHTMRPGEKRVVREWLDKIGVPLGKLDRDGNVVEHGVLTRYIERWEANLRYFHRLARHMPQYPWAWKPRGRVTLGVK